MVVLLMALQPSWWIAEALLFVVAASPTSAHDAGQRINGCRLLGWHAAARRIDLARWR